MVAEIVLPATSFSVFSFPCCLFSGFFLSGFTRRLSPSSYALSFRRLCLSTNHMSCHFVILSVSPYSLLGPFVFLVYPTLPRISPHSRNRTLFPQNLASTQAPRPVHSASNHPRFNSAHSCRTSLPSSRPNGLSSDPVVCSSVSISSPPDPIM